MDNHSDILVPAKKIEDVLKKTLKENDVRDDVANHLVHALIQTSLRGVDSHGIRLFPHYIKGIKGGRINPNPKYQFKKTSLSTGRLDADHTFGHAAAMQGATHAIALAKEAGSGHVSIYNSSHFGAAATYALEIAKHNMIGFSFTNTDALVKTHGGTRPFLGNNPIAVSVPMAGEEPFCLDMSTSVIPFNRIKQLRELNQKAPEGVGANQQGESTTDPHLITQLLPIGNYKGFGLSLVFEVLCSLLSGMNTGPDIPKMFEAPMSEKRKLGHFVMAIRIDAFQPIDHFKSQMRRLVQAIRAEPRAHDKIPIQVAGDLEKRVMGERRKLGIPVTQQLAKELCL